MENLLPSCEKVAKTLFASSRMRVSPHPPLASFASSLSRKGRRFKGKRGEIIRRRSNDCASLLLVGRVRENLLPSWEKVAKTP
jgi:hypothetical protein